MRFNTICFLTTFYLLSCTPHPSLLTNQGVSSLKRTLNQIIIDSNQDFLIGVKIISLTNGKILYELNSKKLLIPASNNKLYTCAAALDYLGKDYMFTTNILRDKNNIILQGHGDPDLTVDQLDSLAKITSTFLKTVDTLFLDATSMDSLYFGKGWMWDEGAWWYAAPVGALTVNDNCIDFYISPDIPGKPANINYFPYTEYISLSNHSLTVTNNIELEKLKIDRDWVARTNHFKISGEIFYKKECDTLRRNIYDPTLFTGTIFRESLNNYGVKVKNLVKGTLKKDFDTLAYHNSNPIIFSTADLMNESDNLKAELFIKTIGITNQSKGNWQNGINRVKSFLSDSIGIDTSMIRLADGSGLSRYNLTSADHLTSLLIKMYSSKHRDDFISVLPGGGWENGTLENRLEKEGAMIRAKTGGLSGVNNLSGYIFSPKYGPVAFSILINGFVGDSEPYQHIQNEIVQNIIHD